MQSKLVGLALVTLRENADKPSNRKHRIGFFFLDMCNVTGFVCCEQLWDKTFLLYYALLTTFFLCIFPLLILFSEIFFLFFELVSVSTTQSN